jgi:hypothetical protein
MRKFRLPSLNRLVASAAVIATSTLSFAAAPVSDNPPAVAKFSVAERTEVPGLTLQPGSYSIKVIDHLADRYIVRVDSANGNVHSTFIGLPNATMGKASASGLIKWGAGPEGQNAVRGYTFPGGTTVQFVYPKAEAVSIAKSNASKVPAIDPASEGKVEAKNLSKDDMEIVTLWMLSSTQVGPSDSAPEIKAERYQASASTPPPPRKPVITALPHTASFMPVLFCLAIISFVTAAVLRRFRLNATRS